MIDMIGTLLHRMTATRAANLDAALSSRAPAATAVSTADATAGRATNLDAALSGLLGSIKSIQYGSISFSTGISATATITSVNTAKAFIVFLGQSVTVSATFLDAILRVELTNATTVTAASGRSISGPVRIAKFVVVEFN